MSRNYDNWERLVAAVLRRELIWKLCHQQSRTPSLRSSISSDFSSSFRSTASLSFTSFDFANVNNGCLKSARSLPFKTVSGVEKSGRVVHSKDALFAFTLEELLMAPSFVLGEELETFKNTYAVSFKEDIMVVVKRLGGGMATPEVSKKWLMIIQSIEHDNVVRLKGYLLNEDENFGFYDYFHQGSVHTMLHGKKGENGRRLDWDARIRIAIGAARGLLHIHRQENGSLIHGCLKASNVFLNSQDYGCVDIQHGFIISFQNRLYHGPEVYSTKKISQASDVYSFGVLLIELVSGRSPMHYIGRHETIGDWAFHNARDEWTAMVFDRGILKYSRAKQAMWDVLGVALSCVRRKPQERPNMEAHPWVREGGEASDIPLDISVLSNMRRFVTYSRLKQFALRALAGTLDEEELADLRDQLDAIDVDRNGVISLKEMRQALAKDLPWKMKESCVLEILDAVRSFNKT